MGYLGKLLSFPGPSHVYRRHTWYETAAGFPPANLSFITGDLSQEPGRTEGKFFFLPPSPYPAIMQSCEQVASGAQECLCLHGNVSKGASTMKGGHTHVCVSSHSDVDPGSAPSLNRWLKQPANHLFSCPECRIPSGMKSQVSVTWTPEQ